MTEIPKTIDEAWGAFNSRVFNHGKDESAYNSFRAALSCLFAHTPSPVDRLIVTEGAWQWWAGRSEEWFEVGPEATKEAIIQAATNDSLGETDDDGSWKLSFHIVEARQDPLRIADWLDLDALIERAEDNVADSDRVASENDDGPWFECSPEQEKDLRQRVAQACDEWQAANGLAFKTATFSHTRNSEHVVVDVPIEGPAANAEGGGE